MTRPDGRSNDELRPLNFHRDFVDTCAGSVLVSFGRTRVLCTASVSDGVPRWMQGTGKGWVTAEYSMLPGSSPERIRRRTSGRTQEIQRLIGRSLRAVVDMEALGEREIVIDCDVLQADGGTRTASITGGMIALIDAINSVKKELPDPKVYPLRDSVAAISVGIVDGKPTMDLDYPMDYAAAVDMNVVMTGKGNFVEVQGTGEESTFTEKELGALITLAKKGCKELTQLQSSALGKKWPF